MNRENLHLTKGPEIHTKAAEWLRHAGLSFEYLPAFLQESHSFHTHDFVEILFVLGGTFRHVTADWSYDEAAGGLTILNYNQFHTLLTPNGPVELMNVYWDLAKYPQPDLPEPLATRLHELIPSHPRLGHRLNRIFHLQMDDSEKTEHLLRMLYAEQQNEAAGCSAAVDALFRLFLIELCRAAPAAPESSVKDFNPRMETVRCYLDQHYAEPVRLEQLCALSGLRTANLCRQFKAHTGLGTGDYLKQRRLAAALQKLRTTSEKILTICYECGFSDISNFNRTFQSAFGQTPTEYRRHARSAAESS
ncbi:MAG: AraC family transcriptional regulator [Kiritimatiellales bacterium]|nr:AraC family transcriptional regulator [Kiritimatiellales bacterium]